MCCSCSLNGSSRVSCAYSLYETHHETLDDKEALFSDVEPRKRLAVLCLPSLLDRCSMVLRSYLADQLLRGAMPFPR
jgi:hypothetical protein